MINTAKSLWPRVLRWMCVWPTTLNWPKLCMRRLMEMDQSSSRGPSADDVEERAQAGVRKVGHEALRRWAQEAEAKASQTAPPLKNIQPWLKKQQGYLLENKTGLVLRNLARRWGPPGAAERPAAKDHSYLSERRDHLNCAQARREGLPIGSGEIESARRRLIQPRLKIPGAWKEQRAELMLNLRAARANGLWAQSWSPHLH